MLAVLAGSFVISDLDRNWCLWCSACRCGLGSGGMWVPQARFEGLVCIVLFAHDTRLSME